MRYQRFTKEEKEFLKQRVEELAQRGVSDTKISRELKISKHVVQRTTTKYWETKMKNKNDT